METTIVDRIKAVTIAVRDQDEALSWYVDKLGFAVKADISVPGFRWLTVAPEGQEDIEFLLASWFPDHVGRNATCVLHTKDCENSFRILTERGVEFTQPPQSKPYGTEAVFKDLYGNGYALVQV
jgi:uncharacterized glyoxalase superfamily protein PhnB